MQSLGGLLRPTAMKTFAALPSKGGNFPVLRVEDFRGLFFYCDVRGLTCIILHHLSRAQFISHQFMPDVLG